MRNIFIKNQQKLWDLWCISTVVGIWPRFIEPSLLKINQLTIPISSLPSCLEGLKIVQFSDLHFHAKMPQYYLNKLNRKINGLKPDLIVFTGDFLCRSLLEDEERLKKTLNGFKARYGCYAILGNHDYAERVSLNDEGEYDVIKEKFSDLGRGFNRLFGSFELKKRSTEAAKAVHFHFDLMSLLKETAFVVLHNDTCQVPIKNSSLNICGLGEYMLGKSLPEVAFKNYDSKYPGIILAHNPDSTIHLLDYPGDLILCGHTHGGQVNLPWIVEKLTRLENPRFKRGLFNEKAKWIYVTTGIGGITPFRWFAIPEIVSFTLRKA